MLYGGRKFSYGLVFFMEKLFFAGFRGGEPLGERGVVKARQSGASGKACFDTCVATRD